MPCTVTFSRPLHWQRLLLHSLGRNELSCCIRIMKGLKFRTVWLKIPPASLSCNVGISHLLSYLAFIVTILWIIGFIAHLLQIIIYLESNFQLISILLTILIVLQMNELLKISNGWTRTNFKFSSPHLNLYATLRIRRHCSKLVMFG